MVNISKILLVYASPVIERRVQVLIQRLGVSKNQNICQYCYIFSFQKRFFFQCVLASVIIVALKGMLMQVKELITFWKFSKMDALVWLTTALTVVLVSIDIGLLVGVIMSLISIFILGFKPYTCLLGSVPNTDLYLDITRYKGVSIRFRNKTCSLK